MMHFEQALVTLVPADARLLSAFDWSSLHVLAIVVWTGFGLLTLALLALMRSSWGRDKPLAKCVALSLLAHALLALSAYGTRLVIQEPVAERPQVFKLRTIDLEEVAPRKRQDSGPLQPWEVGSKDHALPETVPPDAVDDAVTVPNEVWKAAKERASAEVASAALTELPSTAPDRVELPHDEPAGPSANERHIATAADPPRQLADATPTNTAGSAAQDVSGLPTDLPAPPPQYVTPLAPVADRIGDVPPAPAVGMPLHIGELATNRVPSSPITRLSSEEAKNLVAALPPLARPGDGRPIPHVYRLRVDANRADWFLRMGGNADSLRAVHAALHWLAAHQETDGRWDADRFQAGRETAVAGHDRQGAGARADTGMTGLAVLAFLGAGQTQYQGEYQQVVQRALNYLRRQQKPDGNLAGPSRLFAAMYCHGMASLALSEAYALTGDPQLRAAVVQAIRFSLRAQHVHGGWRYQPGDSGDMSQFGWQVMALSSARYAGLGIAESERDRMRDFLQRCSVGPYRALAGYRPGQAASPTMSAEAMVCRVFLQQMPSEAGIRQFQEYVSQQPLATGKANLYYWYYGTLALHQLQGPAWEAWSEKVQTELVRRQVDQGDDAGSWQPDTVWGAYGGRVYSTALAALTLEVYFRYLPIYAWTQH